MSQRQNYIHQEKTKDGGHVLTAIIPDTGVMFSTTLAPTASPSAPDVSSDADTSSAYQQWGDDNKWPTTARIKLEDSTTAYPLIAHKVKMMFGKGLTYYKQEIRNGQPFQDFTPIEEVETFLANNDIPMFLLEQMMDYGFINNAFEEFILDKASKSKIVRLNHLEAEFSRFGEIDKSTYKIKELRYESDWESPTNKERMPFVSSRNRDKDAILKEVKAKGKFAMHNHFPSPGRTLYARPPHNALFEKDGWLDYANSIPKLMNLINKEASTLRVHVEIPGDYWQRAYKSKNWDSLSDNDRKIIIDNEITIFNDWFKGQGNDTFISHFAVDHQGKYLAGWKITPLNLKTEKGKYVTDLQEADIQITRALGMDSSLSNVKSGSNTMGAGSGSDKRTAYTNTISMSHADMYVLTAPLRFVQWFNDWDPQIRWTFLHDIPTTLNDEPSGVKTDQQP